MDVIKSLTDQTKQSIFPQEFITQSISCGMELTKQEIEDSNIFFNRETDIQLIDFMNKNIGDNSEPSSDSLIVNFITDYLMIL
ncbi:unnamed protein product [Didymodactylos carnosus]|uniref:Uncharacterized protein n=1 Tax=Didymodactylos carnosus TaxID=1234261 RepID=A0A816CL09_9BILA|nr:unnamed protein product [Didymodactylos carnosus]CAF1624817.1 unnamed protein product [Didymodactylos carnosus]CAF4346791.1 unnamed protein product [Didymodactylos carnosus]CAF4518023.1 unnamed protein product [Didymodactylos carnosus]